MSATEFDERVALITGAGAGIGRATARRLAAGGASVVLTDKHAGRLEEAVAWVKESKPPIEPVGHLLDIEQRDDFDRVFAEVEASLGPIRIYIWNAALNVQSRSSNTTPSSSTASPGRISTTAGIRAKAWAIR